MQQHPLIKEYLDIAFRRRWWIVVPAVVGVLFSLAIFFKVEKKYKAETRVQSRDQSISRGLLTPIVESNPIDSVTQIAAEITSEKYMQQLEERVRLVGTPGGPRDLSELAKMMQANADVEPNARQRYFTLSVTWNDPRLAATIANELANIYIQANQEIRQTLANTTLEQLRSNREKAELALNDIRAQVQRYRGEHKFQLTDQQQTNYQLLDNKKREIDSLDTQIRQNNGEIAQIDVQLAAPEPVVPGTPAAARDPREEELDRLKRERDGFIATGKTDEFPLLKKANARIAELERELGVTAAGSGGGTVAPRVDTARAALEARKRNLEQANADAAAKKAAIQTEIDAITARLERTPEAQIPLDQMLQQEEAVKAQYEEALLKERKATEGAQIEDQNQGEKFAVLNQARPPKEPFFPDLKMFLFLGLAVGGGLGISMVLLLEVFDQSFKSEEQLAASIDVTVLAVIPDLTRIPTESRARNPARERKRA